MIDFKTFKDDDGHAKPFYWQNLAQGTCKTWERELQPGSPLRLLLESALAYAVLITKAAY